MTEMIYCTSIKTSHMNEVSPIHVKSQESTGHELFLPRSLEWCPLASVFRHSASAHVTGRKIRWRVVRWGANCTRWLHWTLMVQTHRICWGYIWLHLDHLELSLGNCEWAMELAQFPHGGRVTNDVMSICYNSLCVIHRAPRGLISCSP